MEKIKTIFTNFWYWLRPQLGRLFDSVYAEVMRIALEEVKKLMGQVLPQDEKQVQAAAAIRQRLNELGIPAGTSLINLAIEQALSSLKRYE